MVSSLVDLTIYIRTSFSKNTLTTGSLRSDNYNSNTYLLILGLIGISYSAGLDWRCVLISLEESREGLPCEAQIVSYSSLHHFRHQSVISIAGILKIIFFSRSTNQSTNLIFLFSLPTVLDPHELNHFCKILE
jgi:hypothetical protein